MNKYLTKISSAISSGIKAVNMAAKGTVVSRATPRLISKAPSLAPTKMAPTTAPNLPMPTTQQPSMLQLAHQDLSPPIMPNITEIPVAGNKVAASSGARKDLRVHGMLSNIIKERLN